MRLITESSEAYHAKSRSGDFLSSHALADFRKCPQLYRRKQLGLIPDADSAAFLVGRAAHTLILEGREAYESTYIVGGPINPKTGKEFGPTTKKFTEWADAQTKDVLSFDQDLLIENLANGVKQNAMAVELLKKGTPEGVIRSKLLGSFCQIRMDWYDPSIGVVDLKTCADLQWFENDFRRYGYAYNMAFYRSVLSAEIGMFANVHIIAVEKQEPFRCGVWKVGEDLLGLAQEENAKAILGLQKAKETDTWGTGYETVRIMDQL